MNQFSLLCVLAVAVPGTCRACAVVTYESGLPPDIAITDESALMVWDAQSGIEHFVRQAEFHTKVKDFGFLVPTPSKPQLGVAQEELFSNLERELLPRTKTIVQRGANFTPLVSAIEASHEEDALGPSANAAASNTASGEETNSVEVVEQRRVGDYNASILRASDVGALTKWLHVHRYTVSNDTREWLAPYVKAGFFLTAFQVAANMDAQHAQAKAVRLTFKSDALFFPYRETESRQKQGGGRTLRVFYVGEERVQGRIENGTRVARWPAQVEYSGRLDAQKMRDSGLSVPNKPLRLTAFLDEASPRPGWGDLKFSSSRDQSELTPPPIIVHEDKRWWLPFDVLLLGAVGIIGTGVVLYKKNSI